MAKKILHIIIKSSHDGVTSYSVRVINALPQYEHHIISCYKGSAYKEILAQNIACENLINSENISYKSLLLKYYKAICFFIKNRFDIIHYHQGGVGLILLAVMFGNKAKVIHHLHSGNLIGNNKKQDISFVHLLFLKFISKYTHQIAVADHVLHEYKSEVKRFTNLFLIKNCTPFKYKRKNEIMNAVGFIGRFSKEKGFQVFLSVSEQLRIIQPKLSIIAIGEKKINSNNVNLIPPSFGVEKFYNCIDLILFSSLAPEGLPLVLLEAISFDVGIITYPLKGVVEILGDDYPLYVKDEDEIISKVSDYYSHEFDSATLSKIHRERCKMFNFDSMISDIDNLYQRLKD